MFRKALLLYCFVITQVYGASAQAINTMLACKNISSDKYLRVTYENDVFSITDRYYTQGVDIELVSPTLKKNPLSRILIDPKFNYTRYGISIQHNGYTPSSLSSDGILYGDHPFAACLMLKSFLLAIDTKNKQRFAASFYGGIIGPAAWGKEMQTSIHRGLGNIAPHGWDNQVHNDVILNYQIDYEKLAFAYKNYVYLSGSGSICAGTLNCKASIGATLMAGYFDSPFSNTVIKGRNLRIYAYDHPEISVNGYNATLQGGMFNKTSPYAVLEKNIEPFSLSNRASLVAVYGKFYLEYFAVIGTPEFKNAKDHAYGGFQIAYAL